MKDHTFMTGALSKLHDSRLSRLVALAIISSTALNGSGPAESPTPVHRLRGTPLGRPTLVATFSLDYFCKDPILQIQSPPETLALGCDFWQ